MDHFEYIFKSADNLDLYGQGWRTDKPIKGIICLVHGIGSHCGRYESFAANLTAAGYNLVAFDQRGHGKSQGKRGHTSSNKAWMNDITLFLETVQQKFGQQNYFLYGHSLGGNQVLNYILRMKPDFIKGAIASSPALRLAFTPSSFKKLLSKMAFHLFPRLSISTSLDISNLSHDPKIIREYQEDPLVHDKISASTFIHLVQAGEWALKHAAELPFPLLLMHGSGDIITSYSASEHFAQRAGEKCTFKLWDGLYHELHNELQRQKVIDFVIKWLQDQG
ncbi:alpha/beta hydrolase [Candidatus Margulisiibacteriota bacterium]